MWTLSRPLLAAVILLALNTVPASAQRSWEEHNRFDFPVNIYMNAQPRLPKCHPSLPTHSVAPGVVNLPSGSGIDPSMLTRNIDSPMQPFTFNPFGNPRQIVPVAASAAPMQPKPPAPTLIAIRHVAEKAKTKPAPTRHEASVLSYGNKAAFSPGYAELHTAWTTKTEVKAKLLPQ